MARFAVRELWISFRLFALMAAFVAAGAAVALLPSPLPTTMARLAVGLGAATLVAAAVAAWSMAEERRAGRAGWLITRSLPRGTLLLGWFAALASVALVALAGAAVLGWFAAASVTLGLQAWGYASLLAGVAATLLAAMALGLLAGTLLSAVPAAVISVLLAAAGGTATWLAAPDPTLVPGGAFAALAALSEPGAAVGPGLRAAGVGLAGAAILLVLARLALERAEL